MKKLSVLFWLSFLGTSAVYSQNNVPVVKETVPKNWHQLDPAASGFNGISLDKAYSFIKQNNLKSKKVIVAVIDSGIDTLHEDLKPVLWTNPGEIPGNGIDDDHNGYIDDVHGWNFLGGKDGRNVKEDSDEGVRVYYRYKDNWENRKVDLTTLSTKDKLEYQMYLAAREKVMGNSNSEQVNAIIEIKPKIIAGDSAIRKALGKEEYNGKDLASYTPTTLESRITKAIILNISKDNDNYEITNNQILEDMNAEIRKGESASTPPKAYRKEIVKDDETNLKDRNYGNNDIMANTPFHGTHCSGIIGAARDNGKGVDGIADNVSIMMLRAVPDGDEHDKDIANAIYYAVDNGAKVISMSFGKEFSPEKQWVDDAFRYAESKNVLLIHAAGNSAKNIDSTNNFPNPVYVDGKGRAVNIITVGASGDLKNGGLTASFSNFGKREVDVFAPGVNINSTIPGGNTYGNASGTSMAGPVVAGVAALLLEYYPALSAKQVKYVIEKSALPAATTVRIPGTDELVNLTDISKTGGFVNAYEAIKLASAIKGDNDMEPVKENSYKKKVKKVKYKKK